LVASLLSVDIFDMSYLRNSSGEHLLVSLLAVAVALTVSVLHLSLSSRNLRTAAIPHAVACMVLFVGSGTAAYWSGQRFYEMTEPYTDVGLLTETPGQLRERTDLVAVTERGMEVPLYHWDVNHDAFEYYAALEPTRYSSLWAAVIQRAPPDERANCHGWVFTGGKYLLRGRGVEQILADNGYSVTDSPQPGDLVIYRDAQQSINHTALVRGVLDEGTVMVESKWGIDGRYLHRPEDQPYAPDFRYYRRSRPGHQVSIQSKSASSAGNGTSRTPHAPQEVSGAY